ncbi:MAG: nitroreductase family protein [Mycobacterium sp.]
MLSFPDPATIRTVLTMATQAPSVHNSQPWNWKVGPQSLSLYADPSRRLTHADPDRRNLLVSCGAALHHCVVALAASGWHAKVQRLPNPADADHLAVVTVVERPAGELDFMLAAAIGRRRTDRRIYGSWPVPWGDIALMGARAARAGVMLRQVDAAPRLSTLIADSAARHAADPAYVTELRAWSGRRGSVSGVPAGNIPEVVAAAPIPGRVFAEPELPHPGDSPATEDNGVLVALGTEGDDDLARLRAGEATSLVLLSATAMGLATCPVTEPLEFGDIREAVRADVFGATGYPQMLVRVGWAPVHADPLPATPRRPLSEVAEWVAPGPSAAPRVHLAG